VGGAAGRGLGQWADGCRPVPGVIGCLQALEAIKVITGRGQVMAQRMLLFNGTEGSFRVVRLRPRHPQCAVCGDAPSITHLIDYEAFCQAPANDLQGRTVDLLVEEQHVSCEEYKQDVVDAGLPHVLLDVRSHEEFAICALHNSWHVPLSCLDDAKIEELKKMINWNSQDESRACLPVFVVCRRGNDSQRAVARLIEKGLAPPRVRVRNLRGGLQAWHHTIDPHFPLY
jgi:adenylyltransferase/sulfurtransferase